MSNHILSILEHWHERRDDRQWLLVTIIATQGSAYRKSGAMMMFDDSGQQHGLVSGGCLESDILQQGRRCWLDGNARVVTYDMQEEGDIAWRLGVGCGGAVTLLLQPVSKDNHYLQLDVLRQTLLANQPCRYEQPSQAGPSYAAVCSSSHVPAADSFSHLIQPPVRMLVLGGGYDAQPLVTMAANLGWQVSINDPRARFARQKDFQSAVWCGNYELQELPAMAQYQQAQVVIMMHHQLTFDAESLALLARHAPKSLQYCAMLGPVHRTERALEQVQLTYADLPMRLATPAGLDIGGDLPESIALSILSQAHGVLFRPQGQWLKP